MKVDFGRLFTAVKSRSFHDVLYVAAVKAATLLIPLITMPWILRALQPTAFGEYALALALVQYAVILVDFGFFLTATKRIAKIRDNQEQLTRYFWTVQVSRLLLGIIGAAVILIAVVSVPKFRPLIGIAAANLPILLGTLCYPQWLFLGIERIRFVSIANIAARAMSAIPVFILVKDPGDAALAAFLSSCNYLLAGAIACAIIYRYRIVGKYIRPRRSDISDALKDAWPLFLTSMAFSLYSGTNAVILGLVKNSYQVGLFGAADKIRQAAIMPTIAVSTVYFPRVSRILEENRAKALRLLVVLTFTLGLGGALVSIAIYTQATLLVRVFTGGAYEGAVAVLQILSLIPFLSGLNTAFGPLALVNLDMSKQCSRIIVSCGLVNVGLLFLLGSWLGARGAAISLVATEALVTLWMAAVLIRCGSIRNAKVAIARGWGH